MSAHGRARVLADLKGTFRSLKYPDYRLWWQSALLSNIGTWMQRTAQDWLVLTVLTRRDATALGVVMALQFGPQALLMPWTGPVADRFDRRSILLVTQSTMGLLALGLGIVTLGHWVQLWHVYVFALLLGTAAAFDTPTRQLFVSGLVPPAQLANAVGLNSTSFTVARTVGPALAGLLIAHLGLGQVFLLNAASFIFVLLALLRLRARHPEESTSQSGASYDLGEALSYLRSEPRLCAVLFMVAMIGTFGLNFPIFISTMAVRIFHAGAKEFGLLSSILALGSVTGALFAARGRKPGLKFLVKAALVFACGVLLASVSPSYLLFALLLLPIGAAAQSFTTTSNTVVQLSTEGRFRARVMSFFLALYLGGTPLGAPLVGAVTNHWGPRYGMLVGASSGLLAAFVGYFVLRRGAGAQASKLPFQGGE